MRVKLIDALTYEILDQFKLNKSLQDTIKYLHDMYDGRHKCCNGCVEFYVIGVKG